MLKSYFKKNGVPIINQIKEIYTNASMTIKTNGESGNTLLEIAKQTVRGALVGKGRGGVTGSRNVVIEQDMALEKKKKICMLT